MEIAAQLRENGFAVGGTCLTMEETAEEFHDEAQRYLSVDCPKSAAMWQRYGDNEGHVFGSINEI